MAVTLLHSDWTSLKDIEFQDVYFSSLPDSTTDGFTYSTNEDVPFNY
mgnify:FL=1